MIIRTRPGLILQNWYPWIRDIDGTNVVWQLKGIVSGCSWVQIPACHSRMEKSKLKIYWSNCNYRVGRFRNYQLNSGTRQPGNIFEGSFPQPSWQGSCARYSSVNVVAPIFTAAEVTIESKVGLGTTHSHFHADSDNWFFSILVWQSCNTQST